MTAPGCADGLRGQGRDIVIVSGYYGFDNLGDEAILEELVNELTQLVPKESVVVLSANPEKTARTFAVEAQDRFSLAGLMRLLPQARLFVSGGGGLFQDTKSPLSCLYYGGQLVLARAFGVPSVVYAQGLGPLKQAVSQWITRESLKLAAAMSVRDTASGNLAAGWGLQAETTADPVWNLAATALPASLASQLDTHRAAGGRPLVGLSLRKSPMFSGHHAQLLKEALTGGLPAHASLVLLPLQPEDRGPLSEAGESWRASGRQTLDLDVSLLTRPSQWLSLMERLDLVVGMRLHALIMALKAGVPVVGIPYDPKVTALLTQFEQPILNLTNEGGDESWQATLRSAYASLDALSTTAVGQTEAARDLACQNFNLLARILGHAK